MFPATRATQATLGDKTNSPGSSIRARKGQAGVSPSVSGAFGVVPGDGRGPNNLAFGAANWRNYQFNLHRPPILSKGQHFQTLDARALANPLQNAAQFSRLHPRIQLIYGGSDHFNRAVTVKPISGRVPALHRAI